MSPARFDLARLHRDVDHERASRGLSWAALSREVGVSTSTIRRFEIADDAEADGVLALVRWLGVPPETFLDARGRAGEPLATEPSMVRVDMRAVAEAAGVHWGGRERTTIQRLAEAAHRADVDIASMTRLTAS